jgi:hypothetical protein
MGKTKKIFLWIIGIVLFLGLIDSDLTTGTKTAIIVGILLYLVILEQNKRFRRIENVVGILNDPTPQEEIFKTPAYKLDIVLEPNWSGIIEKLARDNKTDTDKFVAEIKSDKNLNIDNDKSLCGKLFRFVYFHDGVSHLEQVWSDYHKTFIDEMEIRGRIFESKDTFSFSWIANKKYKDNNISNTIVMTPDYIGFDTILPDGTVMEEDKLSVIPFGKIIQLLLDLHKNIGVWGAMYRIKKFPQELIQEFEKSNIKYEDWDYEDYGCGGDAKEELIESEWTQKNGVEICDQKMKSHIFSTPFYIVRVKMEIFE